MCVNLRARFSAAFSVSLFVVAFGLPSAHAQAPRAMSFVDSLELPSIQDPQLSPDGKTILFVLEKIMPRRPATGVALAFGPGLAMEGFRFGWTDGDAC